MNEERTTSFVGYEYKEVTVSREHASMYLDCYENFGWTEDNNTAIANLTHQATLRLKRDRKIINKMELTRLQRHFEACAKEIESMEQSKYTVASVWALIIGVLGTAFMAGSTFAVTADPPIIWLCVLLAIPGIVGWIAPYFLYRYMHGRQSQKIQPLLEAKYEEIYEICQKGHDLM